MDVVAKGMHRARYELSPLEDVSPEYADSFYAAQYVIMGFLEEINHTSPTGRNRFAEDLSKPGTVIDFASHSSTNYPNAEAIVVHGTFLLEDALLEEDDDYSNIPEQGQAILIEHLYTGFFFAIYVWEQEEINEHISKYQKVFDYFRVYDFSGTKDVPLRVQKMYEFGMPDGWEQVDPASPGTRVGGIPLNPDGTPYSGIWPGTFDGKFSFVAQYLLEDGRYLHVFQNDDMSEWDYAGLMPDDEQDSADPYSVVLLDGKSFGSGFVLDNTGERAITSPDIAYARKPLKNATTYHGVWVQDEDPPGNRDYELLMHFGDGAQCNGETIIDEISSVDYHLFFNRKTGRAKVIMQCT